MTTLDNLSTAGTFALGDRADAHDEAGDARQQACQWTLVLACVDELRQGLQQQGPLLPGDFELRIGWEGYSWTQKKFPGETRASRPVTVTSSSSGSGSAARASAGVWCSSRPKARWQKAS